MCARGKVIVVVIVVVVIVVVIVNKNIAKPGDLGTRASYKHHRM